MWQKEENPIWDQDKERIFNTAHEGCYSFKNIEVGTKLRGNWWVLSSKENKKIGYGWINESNNDAEISVIVNKKYRDKNFGSKILNHLETEALDLGCSESVAVVRNEHPFPRKIFKWLIESGYFFDFNLDNSQESIINACSIIKIMNVTLRKNLG